MKPWIKFWKNDLLSSLNYQELSIYQKGIYHQMLLLCRDDEYVGQLCWPNGNPQNIEEIIRAMHPKERDRVDRVKTAIDELIQKGLIFWNNNNCLEVRNYFKKTRRQLPDNCRTTARQLSHNCPEKTLKKQDGYKPLYSYTYTDTYKEKNKKRETTQSQIQELFDNLWLIYPRKVAKQKALIRWVSLSKKYGREFISTTVPFMFKALEKQKLSKQWMKDGGEFIPHFATWLNQERWNDEVKDKEDWRDG